MTESIPARRIHLADVILPEGGGPDDTYGPGMVAQMILATATDGTELYVIILDTGDAFAYKPDEYVTKAV